MQARLTATERVAIAATVLGALVFVAGSAFLAASDLLVEFDQHGRRPGPDDSRRSFPSVPPPPDTPLLGESAVGR